MIDQRFMDDLAKDFVLPTEMPVEDTMLAAGPITSDVPQTGVRLGRAGVTPQQSAKAGGLDKPLIALLDTLAGAMRGATGAAIGLPGDIRSIVDMINQEGAEAVMGKRMFPTSEEVLQSNILPQVVPAGAPNAAERQKTVDVAQAVGEFLPAPGLLDVPKVVKGATKAVQATKGMPVGMSTQMVGEGVSELGFYSAAKEAVNAIQQPKGTGEQFLKQIEKTPGVKPDEIKWTGLDDFLKSKKTVTKAEVQEYLDKNRVEIKEVQLGGPQPDPTFRQIEPDLWESNVGNIYKQGSDDFTFIVGGEGQMYYFNSFDEAASFAKDFAKTEVGKEFADNTKFSQYTLPGGENYREILLTLPAKGNARDALGGAPKELTASQAAKTIGMYESDFAEGTTVLHYPSGAYIEKLPNGEYYAMVDRSDITSKNLEEVEKFIASSKLFNELPQNANKDYFGSHFDQPNVLAHMRVNDRVDADGKKVLFVEEVQSDWHQTGRKKGYKNLEVEKQILDIEEQMSNLADIRDPVTNQIVNRQEFSALWRKKDELLKQMGTVPDAPFKTTWHELALKRAIQLASEGGYDRVAFTTGKTQAERYDLSKQINELAYKKMDDELTLSLGDGPYYEVVAVDKNDMPVLKRQVTEQELPDLVGKEMAKKIINGEGKGYPSESVSSGTKVFSGLDLQVGGEGMKGFYDQILPKFLDKYAKKWDAKTSQMNMFISPRDGSVQIQYIDITPKMKESVLTKGQPLFAVGGAGAAMQQEDNK
jgi:hypothetical protein